MNLDIKNCLNIIIQSIKKLNQEFQEYSAWEDYKYFIKIILIFLIK